jgi:hypothetical protein
MLQCAHTQHHSKTTPSHTKNKQYFLSVLSIEMQNGTTVECNTEAHQKLKTQTIKESSNTTAR